MKKIYRLKNLDCANCASKIENHIKKINGVKEVNVNFMSGLMKLEISDDNIEEIIKNIKKQVKKVESDLEILEDDE